MKLVVHNKIFTNIKNIKDNREYINCTFEKVDFIKHFENVIFDSCFFKNCNMRDMLNCLVEIDKI